MRSGNPTFPRPSCAETVNRTGTPCRYCACATAHRPPTADQAGYLPHRRKKAGNQVKHGGLARPAWAQQRNERSGGTSSVTLSTALVAPNALPRARTLSLAPPALAAPAPSLMRRSAIRWKPLPGMIPPLAAEINARSLRHCSPHLRLRRETSRSRDYSIRLPSRDCYVASTRFVTVITARHRPLLHAHVHSGRRSPAWNSRKRT